MNDSKTRSTPPRNERTSVRSNGRKISLTDLPLVAYALGCGHVGRDHGIALGDQLFCLDCSDHRSVAAILAE